MFLLSALLLSILQMQQINLHNISTEITRPFHQECVRLAPQGKWKELYQATVCGKSLRSPELLPLLKNFGLLHLVVVSGAHLVFLERLMWLVGLRAKILTYGVLVFFLLITQAQAPLVRALLGLILQDANEKFHLFWSSSQTLWLSGLLTWVLFPEWIHSFSFMLSWCCSFMLIFSSHLSPLKREFCMYIFIGFFLLPLQMPHPFSIFLNLLLAPIIGFFLFPTSLFAFLVPPLTHLVDFFWEVLSICLSQLNRGISGFDIQSPVPLLILWSVLWLFHFVEEIRRRRM